MRNKRAIRILAIILVILLAGGAGVSALFRAFAYAETALPLSTQRMTIEYLEEQQALHISQRLDYVNRTGAALEAEERSDLIGRLDTGADTARLGVKDGVLADDGYLPDTL